MKKIFTILILTIIIGTSCSLLGSIGLVGTWKKQW